MAKDKSKAGKSSKPSASSKLQEFSGFKVLPVHMNRGAIHYMYMKKHESRVDSAATPKDRTLFLLNLPTDTTEAHLKKLFKPYARIVNVKYHTRGQQQAGDDDDEEDTNVEEEQEDQTLLTKRQKKMKNAEEAKKKESDPSLKIRHLLTTGSYAHVVVLDTKELDNLLNMGAKKRDWNIEDEATLPLGFDRYRSLYSLSHPSSTELQQRVDYFIIKFQAAEYEKERIATEQQNKMDEDGFIMVTRHHRRGTNTDGTVTVTAAKSDRQVKPQKKKELVNFYRFQMREQKRDQLVELRKKFEVDRKKIEQLKQTRKFRPY
ncbi:hypothetical protein NQZ79_g6727 [Umbelopsis isabellina]|nr:hypothetical protein NQZ79_g6727 [Umbelopsis isabellina]